MNARRESGSWDFSQQQNARNWRKNSSRKLDYSHNRKAAQKAAYANSLSRIHKRNADESRIFDALQNEKIFIFGEYNRKERKEIESRWFFLLNIGFIGAKQ